jgi:hypothetical protein
MKIVDVLWMVIGSALSLTAYRFLMPSLNDAFRPFGLTYDVVMATSVGLIFTGILALARLRLRRDPMAMSQPGHWLLAYGLAAVIANAGAITAYYGWWLAVWPNRHAQHPPYWVPFNMAWAPEIPQLFHQAVGWGLGAVAALMLYAMTRGRAPWHWRVLFLAMALGAVILTAGHSLAAGFVWGNAGSIRWCWRSAHLYGEMVAGWLALLIIALVRDARQGRRGDALHWSGVATWLLIGAMQFTTYCRMMLW